MSKGSSLTLDERALAHLRKRHRSERRFQRLGKLAVLVAFAFLAFLMTSIVSKGYTAFFQYEIKIPVTYSAAVIDKDNVSKANYSKLLYASMRSLFPDVKKRGDKRKLYALVSKGGAYQLRDAVMEDTDLIGTQAEVWMPVSSDVDVFLKGHVSADVDESRRQLKDNQLAWIETLQAQGRIRSGFNTIFFSAGDSRDPELAGVLGSIMGSIFTIMVCMAIAFPLAVMTAVYLEEFASRNRWTDLIEVNLNNLAAVPSIIFGLLGLSIFLGVFGLPRSASLVGGITLSMMVLPTIVITTRNALKAVPPSIRDGARALGASPLQVVWHHSLPLAMPGIMTGTILSVARALGETAPLLMIGMVAFVADIPTSIFDPATSMPVQVFLWADSPEIGFLERTSAAIMVLLTILLTMNALAVYLRKKYEVDW